MLSTTQVPWTRSKHEVAQLVLSLHLLNLTLKTIQNYKAHHVIPKKQWHVCRPDVWHTSCLVDGSAGPEDIEAAAALVGFPAVIKPIAAAASMGVVRVDDLQELRQKVESTQKQLESLYLDEHVSGVLLFSVKSGALQLPLTC
jgi:hypothetical protein